jgi:hypothetical protein
MNNRKCLECNEPLRGRADQKFCNDQCRSAYNNRQFVESNNVIRTINRILKKNYFILTALNPEGKTTALKSDLQKKGYRFDYFTCTYTTRSNRIYYFCYDQGCSELENNKVILVRRDLNGDLATQKN